MSKGSVWGHDFLLRDHPHHIDTTYGSSLTYAEVLTLEQADFFAVLDQGFPEETRAISHAQVFYRVRACFVRGRKRVRRWPTSKAPISVVFHSFWLIFGRVVVSRNGLEALMFFLECARAKHPR